MAALVGAKAAPEIGTVMGRLVERYRAKKKVWVRNRWHLTPRFLRKVLSYAMAVCLCQEEADLPPLRFRGVPCRLNPYKPG
jgi:hypothetical protein